MTGSVVIEATIPGKCAAPPAPAIITFIPLSIASLAYLDIFSGVLWAETIFTSDSIPNSLRILIASCITELPLVGKGAIENALKKRSNKPILIIDLGVPRNIEDEIREIEQVYLYSIDDIEKITQENFGQRSIEADKAMKIIVLDAKTALESINNKTIKDDLNEQLTEFLRNLSKEEIAQFNKSNNYLELVKSIKTMNIKDSNFNNFEDLKSIE